jgi:hypothetical protein
LLYRYRIAYCTRCPVLDAQVFLLQIFVCFITGVHRLLIFPDIRPI